MRDEHGSGDHVHMLAVTCNRKPYSIPIVYAAALVSVVRSGEMSQCEPSKTNVDP